MVTAKNSFDADQIIAILNDSADEQAFLNDCPVGKTI